MYNEVTIYNRLIGILTKQIVLRTVFFVSILAWCIGFSSTCLFPSSPYAIIASPFVKKFYGAVCHQHIEKTFITGGHYFFVCARCTGIYAGALIISLISIFMKQKFRMPLKLLCLCSAPMLIDVISANAGVYGYSKIAAFITGAFFGSAVFAYILAGLENNFVDKSL